MDEENWSLWKAYFLSQLGSWLEHVEKVDFFPEIAEKNAYFLILYPFLD